MSKEIFNENVEVADEASLFGLFRSFEGRAYLRELSVDFAKKTGVQVAVAARVASEVSDGTAAAVESMRKALFRRDRKVQTSYSRQERRDVVLCAYLERDMLNYVDFRVLIENRADISPKLRTGLTLADFYYGVESRWTDYPDLVAIRSKLHGVFSCHSAFGRREGSWSHPVFWKVGDTHRYRYFHAPEQHPFLVVHSFEFSRGLRSRPSLKNVKNLMSGFAFPLANGQVHCLFVHRRESQLRHIEIYTPMGEGTYEGKRRGDLAFTVEIFPLRTLSGGQSKDTAGVIDLQEDETMIWRRPKIKESRNIENIMYYIRWDIGL